MKKYLLIAILSLFAIKVNAQSEYCNKIVKEVNDLKGETKYSTPGMIGICFYKNFVNGTVSNSLVAIGTYPVSKYSAIGIYIKLDDGTILKNENAKVICSYSAYQYYYYAQLNLNEDQLKDLSSKKIVKYGIDDFQYEVKDKEAIRYIAYVNCLNSIVN